MRSPLPSSSARTLASTAASFSATGANTTFWMACASSRASRSGACASGDIIHKVYAKSPALCQKENAGEAGQIGGVAGSGQGVDAAGGVRGHGPAQLFQMAPVHLHHPPPGVEHHAGGVEPVHDHGVIPAGPQALPHP